MAHHKLREDKTCLNCGKQVEDRFCTYCGQENTEPRQSFHYLFTHFIEDLVHYDGSFWRTIKTLFFKPGKLTVEFLAGKRQSQVNPVKMYIFISFIVFFVMSIFPAKETENKSSERLIPARSTEVSEQVVDSIFDNLAKNKVLPAEELQKQKEILLRDGLKITVDSLQIDEDTPEYLKTMLRKVDDINRTKTQNEMLEEVKTEFLNMLPKVLFAFLPVFAFTLWLVYSKKRFYYYDHGIFTLHYFSMALLSIMFLTILNDIGSYFSDYGIVNFLLGIVSTITIFYLIIYLFIAMHRVYKEKKRWGIIKWFFILMTNLFIMGTIAICLIIYSFINIK